MKVCIILGHVKSEHKLFLVLHQDTLSHGYKSLLQKTLEFISVPTPAEWMIHLGGPLVPEV